MLVKVFCETFKNMKTKPALIMKTSGAGYSVLDRESILEKIKNIKSTISGDLPNVYLMHGDFMDEEINELKEGKYLNVALDFLLGDIDAEICNTVIDQNEYIPELNILTK